MKEFGASTQDLRHLGNRGPLKSAASAGDANAPAVSAYPEMTSKEASRTGTSYVWPTRKPCTSNSSNASCRGTAMIRILNTTSGVWFGVNSGLLLRL